MLLKLFIPPLLLLLILTISIANNESINLTELDDSCAAMFECQKRDGGYWFDCHYDENISDCRCFVGEFSKCNIEKSSLYSMNITEMNLTISPHLLLQDITAFAVAQNYGVKVIDAIVGSSLRTKLFTLIMIIAVVMVIYHRTRESPEKNIRKARHYHKLAEKMYEKGDEEKAAKYYELANYHREKAHENGD
jgi:hypothetical protein